MENPLVLEQKTWSAIIWNNDDGKIFKSPKLRVKTDLNQIVSGEIVTESNEKFSLTFSKFLKVRRRILNFSNNFLYCLIKKFSYIRGRTLVTLTKKNIHFNEIIARREIFHRGFVGLT